MFLYFIRHGETEWNARRVLSGRTDIDLNENGRALARMTAKALRAVSFDLAITSPLRRAKETAGLVLEGREVPTIVDERVIEIDWGAWEGLDNTGRDDDTRREALKGFYKDPMKFGGAPGGESVREVCRRGTDFLRETIAKPEYQDKTILIATHGCIVRGILNSLYDNPEDFWQNGVPVNCAVNIVEAEDGTAHFLAKDRIYYDKSFLRDYYSYTEKPKYPSGASSMKKATT